MRVRRSEYQCSIDGAYFGTTFPHLMLMTYPTYRPPKSVEEYVPRVFGFKLHPSAYGTRCVRVLYVYPLYGCAIWAGGRRCRAFCDTQKP